MWNELDKEQWIGGTISSATIKTTITDITHVGTIVTIVGEEFNISARENNIEILSSTPDQIDLKITGGDILRWRLNSAQPAASQC